MENRRKLVHISMIIFALLIGTMSPLVISLCCLAAFFFNLLFLPRLSNHVLERNSDLALGYSLGLLLYPAVLFIISIIFFDQQVFLLIAWSAMAFGDGFANLLGRYYGRQSLAWNADKSWEGFIGFLLFGITANMLLLLILPKSLRLGYPLEFWFWVVTGANLFAAVWETVPDTIDDNLVVPFSAACSGNFLYGALQEDRFIFSDNYLIYLGLATLLGSLSLLTRRITLLGAAVGTLITFSLMMAFGWLGLIAIAAFFIVGTVASAWKKKDKERLGLAEANFGKRDYPNVLANAGVPFFLAIWALFIPEQTKQIEIMMMTSFAAALSDTVSSELGNIYGSKFINIRNFRKGARGEDGMISLEGSLSGLLGSFFIGLIYLPMCGDIHYLLLIGLAGFVGNLSDSLLGATLQKKGFLNNHTVNFFNTLLAVLVAYILLNL